MEIGTFTQLAERMAERIPAPLVDELNGGIVVIEEARRNEDDPRGVYILGEYITDYQMGHYIALYYGSFIQVFGQDRRLIEEELWETIRHEIRHHIEWRAGLNDLDVEDVMQMAELRHQEAEREAGAVDLVPWPPRRFKPARGWRGRDAYRHPGGGR